MNPPLSNNSVAPLSLHAPRALHQRAVDLATKAQALDTRPHENESLEQLRQGLCLETRKLLADTATLLELILGHYETASNLSGAVVLVDVCFMASFELSERRHQLEAIPTTPLDLLATSEEATGRVLQILKAVETELSSVEGFSSRIDLSKQVSDALKVRSAYTKLRRQICAHQPADGDELIVRIRRVGTQIAKLIGDDAYRQLRIRDRWQISQLQSRILQWLGHGEGPVFREGIRLWQDIAGFVCILEEINLRQELRQHDYETLHELLAHIARFPEADMDSETRDRIQKLRGLNERVDLALEQDLKPLKTWRGLLQEVLDQRFGQNFGESSEFNSGDLLFAGHCP